MKKIWIGTSWKMNKTLSEALAWCETLAGLPIADQIQPFVIPPFTTVREVTQRLQHNSARWLTGVQNMHFADQGAWTGEISPLMVSDTGAQLVELGHSERRQAFNESDETVQLKVAAALRHNLTPLVCVGDSAQEKAWGCSAEVVIRQMKAALAGLEDHQIAKVIFAYEPVWAIGEGGTPATPEEAQTIHCAMRTALIAHLGEAAGKALPLLYGGSVNQQNASVLLDQADIDGLFVGRAAWQAEGFKQLVEIAAGKVV